VSSGNDDRKGVHENGSAGSDGEFGFLRRECTRLSF
jgi:hypothetical protein